MKEMSIERLGMSRRSTNALHRAGIFTVGQMLDLDDNVLSNISNMGTKSINEVRDMIYKICNGEVLIDENGVQDKTIDASEGIMLPFNENDRVIEWAHQCRDFSFDQVEYIMDDGVYEDISIEKLSMSVRSYNSMTKNGFFHLSDICKLTIKELQNVKNLGKKSYDEIMDIVKKHTKIDMDVEAFNYPKCFCVLLKRFQNQEYEEEIQAIQRHLKKALSQKERMDQMEVYELAPEESISQLVYLIVQDEYFTELFRSHVIKKIIEKGTATIRDFVDVFPEEFFDYIVDTVQSLVDRKKISYIDGRYEIVHPSFKEYLALLEDDRATMALRRKAQGATLEEIGIDYGVTRERIRQIINKRLSTHPILREDRYVYLFEKYALDKEMVQKIFNFDPESYEYYCMITKKAGEENYLGIMNEEVPTFIKKNIEAYRYKDCFDIDGLKVEKNRNAILQYILQTKCRNEVTEEQVRQYFNDFLQQYDLQNDSSFEYPERYFETKLAGMTDVLWKYGKRLRYYVIDEEDFTHLLSEIHFNEYKNIEMSAKCFFDNYPDVMRQYDIRDEYELHNLLKKRVKDEKIDFNRMPNIGFGDYSRDMQVFELLLEHAPIHYEELGKLYEEKYGVSAKTAIANWFGCIAEYLHNGVYNIDYEDLTNDERDVLMTILTENIHELEWVKKQYQSRCPGANVGKLNNYNFKKLGYKISVNMLYKESVYKHVETCLKANVLNEDIIDMTSCEWMMHNNVLYSMLQQMKANYEVIEFSRLKYIKIEKLQEQGIGKQELIDFGIAVCDFASGKHFTLHSLKKKGFNHPLFDLGFDDYFYISVLKYYPGCNYVRAGTGITALFLETGKSDVRDLIQNIIVNIGPMDIYDMLDYLEKEYGIITDKWKLMAWIREANLFYSDTMEKAYLDYEQFYEEV